jgi:hypothetical protein
VFSSTLRQKSGEGGQKKNAVVMALSEVMGDSKDQVSVEVMTVLECVLQDNFRTIDPNKEQYLKRNI